MCRWALTLDWLTPGLKLKIYISSCFKVADFLTRDIPEETYHHPAKVNSLKSSIRKLEKPALEPAVPEEDFEIVLAHFDEEMNLFREKYAEYVHVYAKGMSKVPDLGFKYWENLPNVGRESHTYLHHIVENWDHLAAVTIFMQVSQ